MEKDSEYINRGSFGQLYNATQDLARQQQEETQWTKRGHRIVAWACGIIVGLFPCLLCWFFISAYQFDNVTAKKYCDYLSDFVYSGSFLWVSITLLSMSWVDILLHGIRNGISGKTVLGYKILMLISGVLGVISLSCFVVNIATPMDKNWLLAISVLVFLLFAMVTLFFTLKIIRED